MKTPFLMNCISAALLLLVALTPTVSATVMHGPITNPANGHQYYLLSASTWQEAEASAVALGGHLATVRNATENQWLHDTFANYGGTVRNLWIGLNDAATEGSFVWASGEPFAFTNWKSGEPNNFQNEDYVHLFSAPGVNPTPTGFWNDNVDDGSNVVGTYYGVAEVATLKTIYSFKGTPDGTNPSAKLLVGSDGMLYGTTMRGGPVNSGGYNPPGDGTVFRLDPATGTVTKLWDFDDRAGVKQGLWPISMPVESGGVLFGTCVLGGTSGWGTIWKINRDGSGFTRILEIHPSMGIGAGPQTGLTDGGDGWLYGMTSTGLANDKGGLFRIAATAPHTVQPLAQFGTAGGRAPLLRVGVGEFYGVTDGGGTYGYGYLYRFTAVGGLEIKRHFGGPGGNVSGGVQPRSDLVLRDGVVYGATQSGGTHNQGVLFSYRLSDGAYTVLHHFTTAEGRSCRGLTIATNGMLYGVLDSGGPSDMGAVL